MPTRPREGRGAAVIWAVVALFVLVASGTPGRAYGGGHGHGGGYHGGGYWHGDGGHWHGSVYIGPWWWGGPYYPYYPWGYALSYPPPYYPYVVPPSYYPSDQPQAYVQQAPAPPAPPQTYWYYCPSSRAYYPNVRTCSEQWVKVPPRP